MYGIPNMKPDKGGVQRPSLSDEVHPLHLTDQEKRDLLAFMTALNGDGPALVTGAVPKPTLAETDR